MAFDAWRFRELAWRLDFFFQDVEHAREIFVSRFRSFDLGQALTRFIFPDASGFLDNGAAVGRFIGKDLPDAALFDDGVTFGAEAGAHEEILDVAQTG